MPPSFTFLKNLRNHEPNVQPPKNRVDTNHRPKKLRKSSTSATLLDPVQTGGPQSPRAINTIKFPPVISPKPDDPRQKNGFIQQPVFSPPYQASHMENSQARQTLIHDETPVVSRYMSDGFRYAQVQEVALPPSRSWSPIPSVHRESFRDDELYEEDFDDEVKSPESWVNKQKAFPHEADARLEGHVLENLSMRPESSRHELRYIEYLSSSRPRQDHWKSPSRLEQDENTARRETHRSYRSDPEAIEPAVAERESVDPEPEIYHYIIPVGLNVVFQDEDGKEITRVGRDGTSERGNHTVRSAPIIVHDEFGKELYRTKGVMQSTNGHQSQSNAVARSHEGANSYFRSHGEPTVHNSEEHDRPPWLSTSPGSIDSSRSTKTIIVDEKGNQIPLSTENRGAFSKVL